MAVTRSFQIDTIYDRVVTEQISTFVEEHGVKKRQVETTQRVVPVSYMVYFPLGHSLWVESKEELARLRLTADANVEIDTDTGLPVKPPESNNIKERSIRKTINHAGMI